MFTRARARVTVYARASLSLCAWYTCVPLCVYVRVSARQAHTTTEVTDMLTVHD